MPSTTSWSRVSASGPLALRCALYRLHTYYTLLHVRPALRALLTLALLHIAPTRFAYTHTPTELPQFLKGLILPLKKLKIK